jgi:hypothetical protein
MRLVYASLLFILLAGNFTQAAHSAPPPQSSCGLSQSDIQDLRLQIQDMKIMVRRMERNLTSVDTSQSPLKIQFQLEIDMWNTVIAHMEKRLNSSK